MGEVPFQFTDSNTINLSATGDVLSAEVIVDPKPGNALSAGPNGLCVEDVRLQALTWDGTAIGATLTDGTIIPPVDVNINLTPGTYSPDAAGNVTIPLTDGAGDVILSGLVSPEDVDFASTEVAVNIDDTVTVTYLDANGEVITTTTLPAPNPDNFLQEPTLGLDGCTVSFPMSETADYTVSLCDLLSETTETANADGSTTFTHTTADGDTITWTAWPAPVDNGNGTITYRGCVFSGEQIDFDCATGRLHLVTTDLKTGAVVTMEVAPTEYYSAQRTNLANAQAFDASNAAGDTLLTGAHTFTIEGACPRMVEIYAETQMNNRLTGGLLNVVTAYSIDGGTPIILGHGHQFGAGAGSPLIDSETGGKLKVSLDPGAHTIEFYARLASLNNPTGSVTINQTLSTVCYTDGFHCEEV